jgi:phenylacetate-CoA ligase
MSVPYYKNLFDDIEIDVQNGVSIEDFQKIPLLDKENITTNKEMLISKVFKLSDLNVNTTSGSTGKKLEFYNDKNGAKRNDYYRQAVVFRNVEWLGVSNFDRGATIWGMQIDITQSKKFIEKMNRLIFPSLFLNSFEMSNETMKSYAKKINRYRPKVLIGYASALYVFASYLKENQIDVYSPKGIISSAETLSNQQRNIIESVFRCEVFNRYGCREVGCIAQECEQHNGLHINAEHVYVEILDEKGKPCKPGESGQIVITNLDDYGFPFIRYKIEDIGVLSERGCPCGRGLPLLKKVEGRIWDIIVGANKNRLIGTFWLVYGIKGIKQFQVLQEVFGEISVKLVVDESFIEDEKQKLIKRIYDACGEDMKIDIQLVDNIPLTKSGKHRFIISKVSPFVK